MLARYKQEREKGTAVDNGKSRKNKTTEKRSKGKKHPVDSKQTKVLKERWQQKGVKINERNVNTLVKYEKPEPVIPKPIFPPESLNLSDRPIRAAAATAQAISEAQQQFLEIEPPPEFKRNKHGRIEVLVDKPIKTRKYFRRVKPHTPDETNASSKEQKIELTEDMVKNNVDDLVDSFKNQYMEMVQSMQEPSYISNIHYQLRVEKSKKDLLTRRVDQLQMQVNALIQESLEMLKESLRELGIDVMTPVEFIQKAKEIVGNHNDLQKTKQFLEDEVNHLEEEQKVLIYEKEKQLLEHSYDIPDDELMQAVQNIISRCLHNPQLFMDSKGFTLTKVKDVFNDSNNNNEEENVSYNFLRPGNSKNLQNLASKEQQQILNILPPIMSSECRMAMIIEESVRESVPKPQKSIYSIEAQSKNKRKEKSKVKPSQIPSEGLALHVENYASKLDNTKSEGSCSGDEILWQREISSGFDRLVALANEVDTRRSNAVTDSSIQRAGEKLPNRHFKRKYFDQEYLRTKMQKME